MKNDFDPTTYFEYIGAWPRNANGIGFTYVIGYVLSLLLTLGAYGLALQHRLTMHATIALIVVFAFLQFIVQMRCFLHLGREATSRDRIIVFGFAALIVLILISGSLWIMSSLNNRMMPSAAEMNQYMQGQQGI